MNIVFHGNLRIMFGLTHFKPKCEKIRDFLKFSGVIEMERWLEMD